MERTMTRRAAIPLGIQRADKRVPCHDSQGAKSSALCRVAFHNGRLSLQRFTEEQVQVLGH